MLQIFLQLCNTSQDMHHIVFFQVYYFDPFLLISIAPKILSGSAGSFVIIAPVAFLSAFIIAGAVGIKTCSPRPLAPKGPSGSFFSINIDSISGISPIEGIKSVSYTHLTLPTICSV